LERLDDSLRHGDGPVFAHGTETRFDVPLFQEFGKGSANEDRGLVGDDVLGPAMFSHGLLQRLDAPAGVGTFQGRHAYDLAGEVVDGHQDVNGPQPPAPDLRVHLIAYNLIRKLTAQAAVKAGVCPRNLSFTGALQMLIAFAAASWSCPARRNELYAAVLRAVATHRVNNRPDRVEPRAVKRRKTQVYLNEPRSVAKARLLSAT